MKTDNIECKMSKSVSGAILNKLSDDVIRTIATYEANKLDCEKIGTISISRTDPEKPNKTTNLTAYLKDFPTLQNRLRDEYGQQIFKAYLKWGKFFLKHRKRVKVKIDNLVVKRGQDGRIKRLEVCTAGNKLIMMERLNEQSSPT